MGLDAETLKRALTRPQYEAVTSDARASLVLAVLVTYLIEKPGGKLMDRIRAWRQKKTAPAVPEP